MKDSRATLLTTAGLLLMVGVFSLVALGARLQNPQVPDETIKAQVEHRLDAHHLQPQVQVAVQDGVVTLTGQVRSLAERLWAEKKAGRTDGVVRVASQLVVDAPERSDAQIAEAINHQLRRYVFYSIFDFVEGTVQQGNVKLEGAVSLPWHKDDYEHIVERVEGVKSVENNLKLLPTSIFDDQIRTRAARVLYNDPFLERYALNPLPSIHILVENGKVTLEGVVGSEMDRQIAERDVRTGVLSFDVINHLRIEKES